MLKKIIIITLFFAGFGIFLFGQEGRSLHFMEVNGDTRTAGMGDANMGNTKGMYLYTNPTAFFQNKGTINTSYSFGLYPEIDGNRQNYHAVSAAYKLFSNHSIMVGTRHIGGLKIPRVGDDGVKGKSIKPYDWSLDLAYAYKFSPNFSAYAGGSFIQSYIGKTANTVGFNAGLYYRNTLSFVGNGSNYSLGLSVYDLGGKLKFENGKSNTLPTSVGFGGDVSLPVNDNHKINAALVTRYFMLPSKASSFTGGIGLEYEMFNMVALRTGYHFGDSNGYLSLGAGCKFKFVNIDLAYSIADNKKYNLLRLGFSVHF